jgi:hypothetical protein
MIKLAFYKAQQGNLTDKLISWWTNGLYSHVEIVTGSDTNNLLMWTSSAMNGGVRQKKHKYDPTKWEYIDIDLNLNILLQIYNKTKDCKYDYLGILGFVLPLQDRENKWFCSEWVSNVLKCSGDKRLYLKEPSKISPNKLFSIMLKKDK